MYPRFIEVHDKEDDILVSVNVDCIANFFPKGDGDGAIINCRDCGGQVTTESYDDLKTLIQNAGCAIQKGDPRLDTSKPVPWDELTKPQMIGEPLFNSNSRKWMLLIDSASDNTWIDLVNTSGGTERWIEHDAQKYPLYRMGERK